MTTTKLRAGFVGAGDICPVHVESVQALPDVDIVGVCDLNRQRAEEVGAKYGIAVFDSLAAMVEAGANVIHVLTPPGAHARVAIEAMELGCDVLIEKPLAESLEDCEAVIEAAQRTGRVATVDHLLLFDPGIQQAIAAVESGKIGKVVGIDILRGGELLPYEGGPLPVHLKDPGHTFRDLAVHHFYLFQKFLGPIEDVKAEWQSLGGEPSIAWDEWRALVRCRDGLGQFQISFNAKPMQNQIFLHGTKGVLRIDLFSLFQSTRTFFPLPRPVERLINVAIDSVGPLVQTPVSVFKFATKKVQRLQGVRNHVAEFYRRIAAGEPQEVTLADAMELVRWNEVVAQAATVEYQERLKPYETLAPTVDVVITGASGSFGGAILQRLLTTNQSIRALVRRIPDHPIDGVEYAIGNLGDPEFVDRALAGATKVIHCAAVVKGTEEDHLAGTVVGTLNVVDSALKHGITQVVYVSSMSVVDNFGLDGKLVDETVATEPRSNERGAYTKSKLAAEQIVRSAVKERGLPAIILRPGAIIGGGVALSGLAGAMGGGANRFLVLGDGEVQVPLVYVDDAVDAVFCALDSDVTTGEVLQIADNQPWTQNRVLSLLNPAKKITHVPRPVVFKLGKATEPLFAKMGKASPLSEYRLRSGLSKMQFQSTRAKEIIGWEPTVGVTEGIRRYAESLK